VKPVLLPDPEPRLLGAPGASRYLGISVWTLRSLVARGHLKPVKLPACHHTGENRRLLFDIRDLDKFVDECRQS
jgi:Helix-turn-helix domain